MSKEILMVVDAVSNEKGVEKEIVFEAIEAALASATRRKHGEDIDVRVAIDRETGNYDTWRRWMVFADESTELEEPDRELRMIDAVDIDRDVERLVTNHRTGLGDNVVDAAPLDFLGMTGCALLVDVQQVAAFGLSMAGVFRALRAVSWWSRSAPPWRPGPRRPR